jgi:hypothetical protein
MAKQSAQQLIRTARMAAEANAVGPFTPVVIEPYSFIGGERGFLLGYPSESETGSACVVWTHKPTPAAAAQ